MSIIAGIDYSMRSPAICVANTNNTTFDACKILAIPPFKKRTPFDRFYLDGIIEMIENRGTVNHDVIRFDILAQHFVEFCRQHHVEHAIIEDYAYAGSGRVFELAENVGVLKNKLYHAGITFTVTEPTSLKKYATGKGNVKKWPMYDQFVEDTGVNLLEVLDLKRLTKVPSPVDDIVDAYYIVQQFANNK